MTILSYPPDFACPLIADHKSLVDIDAGIVTFENGNRRQRKRWANVNTTITLGFAVSWTKLWTWQVWVNRHAYDWFLMGLYSAHSVLNGGKMIKSKIRFIGDLKVTALNSNYAKVVVEAEFNPDHIPYLSAEFTDTWIIAGTPAAPSADWVLAGEPVKPAEDMVIAGTPINPAAR